ncbi:MAG: HpcH/HpaI aldolase/citrate lyase family protein [Eubacterium sp.]|nr:HpcH/HpaI aldolase/citrate lyase family protein [Eubacterium sp.]
MQNNFECNDLPYRVGGLLYTPALNSSIAKKLVTKEFQNLTSLVLCLEDSIQDDSLPQAERQLKETLLSLQNSNAELPLLFVRVRSANHLEKIHILLGKTEDVLTGYVLPKFDLSIVNDINNCTFTN